MYAYLRIQFEKILETVQSGENTNNSEKYSIQKKGRHFLQKAFKEMIADLKKHGPYLLYLKFISVFCIFVS